MRQVCFCQLLILIFTKIYFGSIVLIDKINSKRQFHRYNPYVDCLFAVRENNSIEIVLEEAEFLKFKKLNRLTP